MSIEQLQDFHQVRRILRAVAPEFRTLATNNLSSGEYALDVTKKTIEIGEGTPIKEAVNLMLFSVGHVLLRSNDKYELLFGKGIAQWSKSEEELIDNLSDLGESADAVAAKWAVDTLQAYWQQSEEEAKAAIDPLRMNKSEWRSYFSA